MAINARITQQIIAAQRSSSPSLRVTSCVAQTAHALSNSLRATQTVGLVLRENRVPSITHVTQTVGVVLRENRVSPLTNVTQTVGVVLRENRAPAVTNVTQTVGVVLREYHPSATAYVTQTVGEVLIRMPPAPARVTQEVLEVSRCGHPNADLTQVVLSSLRQNDPKLFATQITAGALRQNNPKLFATQINALVLRGGRPMGVYEIETEGMLSDEGNPIPFDVETKHTRLDEEQAVLVRFIHIDADTQGAELEVFIVMDGEELEVGTLSTGRRTRETYTVNRFGRVAGVRLKGDVSSRVTVYGVDLDVHVPQKKLD
jgi:hypothetical protein